MAAVARCRALNGIVSGPESGPAEHTLGALRNNVARSLPNEYLRLKDHQIRTSAKGRVLKVMIFALVVALLADAAGARAASFCYGLSGDKPSELTLARVSGHPTLLSVAPSDCRPSEQGCQTRTALAPGTLVASFQTAEGYTCIEANFEHQGGHSGWVPTSGLRPIPAPSKISPDWFVGRWTYGFDEISISFQNGQLYGEGYAESGPHDNPRFGGFDGSGKQSADAVSFKDADVGCLVRVVKFGSQLAVMDNGAPCGTMTKFSGFYTRSSTTPASKGSVVGRGG